MKLINRQTDLDRICLDLQSEKVIAVDTEFERRRTYFARLSIIQLMTSRGEAIIIDALSGINLAPFDQILRNREILKILHSPEQDFDIFYHLFGHLPLNIFDTQLAARICNVGIDLISYSNLCQQLLGASVDKSLQQANWLNRPLSHKLLEYAVRDTEFLIPLYNILSDKLDKQDKLTEYRLELCRLLDIANYQASIDKIIKKMRILDKSESFENKLYMLTDFREECARILDIPRSHCATDRDLIRLCRTLPTSNQELRKLTLERRRITDSRFKNKLFELCQGLKNSYSDLN